jgi:hypothetical protein
MEAGNHGTREPHVIERDGPHGGRITLRREDFTQETLIVTHSDGREERGAIPETVTLIGGEAGNGHPGGSIQVPAGLLRDYPNGLIVQGGQPGEGETADGQGGAE